MKDTDPLNVLAGIMSGDGVGLSLNPTGGLSIVSDFDIQQTLAGRIFSTATGKDTRLGKIGMKAAAISMANNALRKSGKMASGFFHEGIDYLLNKISKGKLGDSNFEMAKYASPSITDAPGGTDNFLSSTGLGGIINAAAGGLGIADLLSNNKITKTATSDNDGKYIKIDLDGVLVEDKENTQPDFDIFLYKKPRLLGEKKSSSTRYNEDGSISKTEETIPLYGSESEYRRFQQTELIAWSGVLTKEQIYQNLKRNKYQPGYTVDKRSNRSLEYKIYGEGLVNDDPTRLKQDKLQDFQNGLRIKNKRNVYTWTEFRDSPNESNDQFGDAVYHGIDQTNISNVGSEFIGDIYQEDSLLNKTRKMFQVGKIKTIISSFQRYDNPSEIQSAVSVYGISKGRNLINKNAFGSTQNNFYDYYCRVWTWERQYRTIQNAIRPFLSPTSSTDPGNEGEPMKLEELHKKTYFIRPNLEEFARFTTLQDNGKPKIAPYKSDFVSYDKWGRISNSWKGKKEDRRKYNRNYMFSIENLAWKDLNLEDILCPSQIGPNGGRIYWFSPLNLDFSETTSVNLNKESFIGRGEQVITYIDSIRTGTFSFTMVVDHSSFHEFMKYRKFENGEEDYHGILLWDAGCDDPTGIQFENIYRASPPPNPPEIEEKTTEEPQPPTETVTEPEPEEKIVEEETKLITRIYFPNDFSGVNYDSIGAMDYIYKGGVGGHGYEMDSNYSLSDVSSHHTMKNGNYFVENIKCDQNDAYVLEKKLFDIFLSNITETDLLYNSNLEPAANYLKSQGELDKHVNQKPLPSKKDYLPRERYKKYMSYWDVENHHLNSTKPTDPDAISFKEFYDKCMSKDADLKKLLEDAKQVIITGNASAHGTSSDNNVLSQNRANTILNFINQTMGFNTSDKEKWISKIDNPGISTGGSDCSSSEAAKKGRFVKVEIVSVKKENYTITEANIGKKEIEFKNEVVTNEIAKIARDAEKEKEEKNKKSVLIKGRYDEEMEFYNYIDKNTDLSYSNIKDKYSNYIPGFWSLTPEGFNGRLTFLNQCTRQGPTISATDTKETNNTNTDSTKSNRKKSKNATNLAFGRPPVCILRIGDFIQSRIFIDNLSIDYKNNGQIQWDLNPEGIGVQPMMANIQISFTFIGGQDISGAIAQLQNAITFNYYANASVYDDRAATNGLEGTTPQKLFNPDTYKNSVNYRDYLNTVDPIETPPIPQLKVETNLTPIETIKADMLSRKINPIAVKKITEEDNT
jgi:hypothetical protein